MLRRVGIAAALGALALPAAARRRRGCLSIEGSFSYVEVKDSTACATPWCAAEPRQSGHVRMLRRRCAPACYQRCERRTAARGDRCARRVRVFSSGLTQVRVSAHVRRRMHDDPPRAAMRASRRGGGSARCSAICAPAARSNSWSLIDSWGRLHGFAPHRVYVSASLVKAMLLTSYLRGIGNRMPDAAERAVLGPMITVSSNDAADTIYYRVGDAALYRLAKAAGMKSFSVAGYWANAHFSAEDQARFFNRIDRLIPKALARLRARPPVLDRLLPALGLLALRRRGGFQDLLQGRLARHRPGPARARGGAVRARRTRFSMAVLTDGNPSHEYGTETLRGVAQRVFGVRGAGAAAEPVLGGTPQPAAPASWTCTGTRRASG